MKTLTYTIIGLAAVCVLVGLLLAGALGDFGKSPERIAAEAAIVEAQADAARAEAERQWSITETYQAAAPAQAASMALLALGVTAAAIVLLVGAAFVAISWGYKKASEVHPDAKGQFPLVIMRGFGWAALHDPNRGLGPTATYRTPTVFDTLAGALALLRTGSAPALPAPAADFPATADAGTMAQIAGQANATAMAAALTRPGAAQEHRDRARSIATAGVGGLLPDTTPRMPRLEVVDDPDAVQHVYELYEGGEHA